MPKFIVWCPEHDHDEEDGGVVFAIDASDAACRWAERDDAESAEYQIASGDSVQVSVKDEDGTLTQFVVSGESMPVYRAKAIR